MVYGWPGSNKGLLVIKQRTSCENFGNENVISEQRIFKFWSQLLFLSDTYKTVIYFM